MSVATVGNGGAGSIAGTGAGGTASATALVVASGAATAEARAYGGAGGTRGTSIAYASATGSSSRAIAGGGAPRLTASVTAEGGIGLLTESVASSAGAGTNPTPNSAAAVQAYSHASGAPDAAQAAALLDGHANVAAALANGAIYGSGTQGTSYAPSAAPGATLGYTLTGEYSFNLDQESTLYLGLLDYSVLGSGFESLTLSVADNGMELFSKAFSTLAEVELFFSDHALSLGVFGAGDQDFTVTSRILTNGASGFAFNYLIAVAVGGANVSPVPEAQGWLLMLPGLLLLTVAARRRRENTTA